MTTPNAALRSALHGRFGKLLDEELRKSDVTFYGKFTDDGSHAVPFHGNPHVGHAIRQENVLEVLPEPGITADGRTFTRRRFVRAKRPEEWDGGPDGYWEVTGPKVADEIEPHRDAIVEATAEDLELMLAELVPVELHAITLAHGDLIKWWPWSDQPEASKWLRLWAVAGQWPPAPMPDGVTPAEVALWMQPALKRHNHPTGGDGPEDIPAEQWEAWQALRDKRIRDVAEQMRTTSKDLDAWSRLEAVGRAVEDEHEARIVTWANDADRSLVKVAQGFTFHNGVRQDPTLRTPILKHPRTGRDWPWHPQAMAWLYLANPATAAARCIRALESLDTSARFQVALGVVQKKAPNDEAPATVAGVLADKLAQRLKDARAFLDVDVVLAALQRRSDHVMLPWDERAAEFYAGLGDEGQRKAETLRAKARERWAAADTGRLFHLWTPPDGARVSRFVTALAEALWPGVAKDFDERRRRETTHPTTAAPLVLLRNLAVSPERLVINDDGGIWTNNEELILEAPVIAVPAAREAIDRGLGAVAFWRLLCWVLQQQWRGYLATGDAKGASVLDVGTITDLARALHFGVGSRELASVRAALAAGASLGHRLKTEEWHALWAVGGEMESRSRKPLRLSLGPVLHVDAAHFMPSTAKLLAPVADPMRMPKPIGDRRTAARQHAADQDILCLAAERSRHGAVDGERWVFPFNKDTDRRAVADRTGLYRDLSIKWLHRLTQQPSQLTMVGKPPLVEVDGGHLAITDPGMVKLLAAQKVNRNRQSQRAKRARADKPKRGGKSKGSK